MSVVSEEKRERLQLSPFVIEARTPRNQDLLIQNLDGLRLRGAVQVTVEVFNNSQTQDMDEEDGPNGSRPKTFTAPARLIDGIGELPGELLHVNPRTGEWRTEDPLYNNKTVLERVRNAIRRTMGFSVVGQELRGVKPRSGVLNKDRMKSLCEELLCFVESREARVVKGRMPTREEIEQMEGRVLLNWMNRQSWKQPKYRDEYEAWEQRINRLEGSV